MRVLLSTIGSRGDVQPLLALALRLKALRQEVHLCVPPDFQEWIKGLGMSITPIGPELRTFKFSTSPGTQAPLTPERLRELAEASVATQFETVRAAAEGCDVIVGATALQIAARSVAERMGIRYVFAAYCPAVLPSPHHAPPPLGRPGQLPTPTEADNSELWARDAVRFHTNFGGPLNAHRAAVGLAPVTDVRGHIFTDEPWLAADATLSPWPGAADGAVFQTGAWILPDERPLSPELESFLDAGEPPVYFGFGSMRPPREVGEVMLHAARALGRRAVVSRGWADLTTGGDARECLTIDEVNQQALFPRVAAVVHHGGAGTTTAAARAGTAQVVVPQMYDQHYWAGRVQTLGIGVAHQAGLPTVESLVHALEQTLTAEVAARARSVATAMHGDGAQVAAERLISG